MKLHLTKKNNVVRVNVSYYDVNKIRTKSRPWVKIRELMDICVSMSDDTYITRLDAEIYDWIVENDHEMLRCKDYSLA